MASRPVHSHRRVTCRVVRLCRVIKVKSWAVRWINCGLAVRRAVTGRTVACRAVTGWAVACRAVPGRAVNCGWAVTCGRAVHCGRSVNCGRAVTCRAVHHLRWTRHWSRTINLKLPGRRRDHSDSSLLGRLDDLGRQLHFPSGDIRRSGPIVALSSSLLMTGRWITVERRPGLSVILDAMAASAILVADLAIERQNKLLTSDNMEDSYLAAGVFPAGVAWTTGSSPLACDTHFLICGVLTCHSWAVPPQTRWKPQTSWVVMALSDLDDPSPKHLTGSWRTSSGACAGSSTSCAGSANACWVVIIMCWVSHACWVIHDLWLVIRCWVVPPCWLVTRRDDPSSFAESGTWVALPCWAVNLLGRARHTVKPTRPVKPSHAIRSTAPIEDRSRGSAILLCWQAANDSSHKSESKTFYVKCDVEKRPLLRPTDKRGKQPSIDFVSCFENAWEGHWYSACQIHIRTRATRKSKWTTGGYGALRRCGCSQSGKRIQFHCLKFCLGSAGEPTICSHCYDVLNEDKDKTVVRLWSL